MIKEYMQDLRIFVKITPQKKKTKQNSHGLLSLANAEGLRANKCNAVFPSVFVVVAKLVAKLGLAVRIAMATPTLSYTKMKNSKQKYSWTEFFFLSMCCSILALSLFKNYQFI